MNKSLDSIYLNGGKTKPEQEISEAKSVEEFFCSEVKKTIPDRRFSIKLIEDGVNTPQNFYFALQKAKRNSVEFTFFSDQLHNPKAKAIGFWLGLWWNLLALFGITNRVKITCLSADRVDNHVRNTGKFQNFQKILFWICPFLIWYQIQQPAQKNKWQQKLFIKLGLIRKWEGRNTESLLIQIAANCIFQMCSKFIH